MEWSRDEDGDERPRIGSENLDLVTEGCFVALGSHGLMFVLALFGAVFFGPAAGAVLGLAILTLGASQWLWLLPLAALCSTFGERRMGLGVLLGGVVTMAVYGALVSFAALFVFERVGGL